MGGGNQTKAAIVKQLSNALERYHDQQQAGADMIVAGEELAAAVERIVIPPPCALPRETVLRERSTSPTQAVEQPAVPLDDYLNGR